MARTFTFVIHPDNEQTSLDLFLKTIDDIRRFVRDIDYSVTRERGTRRWIIESLHSSNPTITVRPLLENEELINAITDGIESISKGTLEPPKHWNEPTLEDLRRMRRLFRGRDRAKSVEFTREGGKPTKIERDIGEKVEKILRGGFAAFGSIEGTLEAVNLHGYPTFTIWDRLSNAPVRCYFPKDRIWSNRIKQLLEKRVITRGKVNYFNNGLPRSIVSIEDVIDATLDLLSKTKAEFGSLSKDRPSDMIEFMRHIREGV